MPNFIGHAELPRALAADARLLLVVGERVRGDSAITVFDWQQNKPKASVQLACAARAAVAVGDGRFVVGDDSGSVSVVNEAGDLTRLVTGTTGAAAILAVAVAGTEVFFVDAAGRLGILPLAGGPAWTRSCADRRLRAIAVSDGAIAVGGDDGIVSVISRQARDGGVRRMAGHDGGVSALTFTRDGRLASGGDDGTLRLWYLTGEPDAEVRGADKSGHDGGVRGLVHVSSGPAAADGATEDRLYTVGVDGTLKGWRLEDKKKPRTEELGGQVSALCVVTTKKAGSAVLFAAGATRKVIKRVVTDANTFGTSDTLLDGFDKAKDALTGARPRREEALAWLAVLDDAPAIGLQLECLKDDKEPDVRAIVAKALGGRTPTSAPARLARAALRTALSDKAPQVRAAAYEALGRLEPDDALAAPRAGVSSTAPDIRVRSLRQASEHRSGPLASVAQALITRRLVDSDPVVAATALQALLQVAPDRTSALRSAIIRGNSTVRFDALLRTAMLGLHRDPSLSDLFARAFDDEDATVRDRSFGLAVALRKSLQGLRADAGFDRKLTELGRRAAQLEADAFDKTINDDDAKAALSRLPVDGTATRGEDDDRPLLLALASRLPDTALRGAWALASFGDVRALGALLQLTRHESDDVRRQAAVMLRAYDADDARTRLVWLLDDKSAAVRAAAFDAFVAVETDARTVADIGLRSSSEDIRIRALESLLRAAGTDAGRSPDHRALLDDALDDESPKVRLEAEKASLVWAGTGGREAALERLLRARFADTRRRAVAELAGEKDTVAWADALLLRGIADLDAAVATAAYEALVKRKNPVDDSGQRQHAVDDANSHLAAIASPHGALRELGAKQARRCRADEVRSALMKLILDEHHGTRQAALESLDVLLPTENGAHVTAMGAGHIDLRVRAGELLAIRKDDALVATMKSVIAGRDELLRLYGENGADQLRRRAASALATLGKPSLVRFFGTDLLQDVFAGVREEAARGLAVACRRGDEAYLLAAIGHADVWVRSWAAEGLARLGDARCLSVLSGTLKHEHLPIRRGAVLSFAAYGADSYTGLLQGLDDDSLELESMVFGIILAHDLQLARQGQAPTLLSASLSAARPEVRFAAARALELRHSLDGTSAAHLAAVLAPEKPEKASELKSWPESLRDDDKRTRLMLQLADALASSLPEQRYAAASALLHRADAKAFARAVEDAVRLRATTTPFTPDNSPRAGADVQPEAEAPVARVRGFLRKVFASDGRGKPTPSTTTTNTGTAAAAVASDADVRRQQHLAFGAYVGLLRQAMAGDEAQRVRRDAVERIVALASDSKTGLGREAALPALMRALDDGQHLVRRAALTGLKTLFAQTSGGVDDALGLALMARAEDIAKLALDELAERGAVAQVERALNSPVPEVRKLAFETLERRAKKGTIAHLVLALRSEHDDLRLSVLEQLSKRRDDKTVGDALVAALDSEHKGLVLRAAEILADRGDDRAVDALLGSCRGDDDKQIARARQALGRLATVAATTALASLVDDADSRDLTGLCEALGRSKHEAALEALMRLLGNTESTVRAAAFEAGLDVVGKKKKRDDARAARFFAAACQGTDAEFKQKALTELAISGAGSTADDAVIALFADRDAAVRTAAVTAYAERCRKLASPTAPLQDVVARGARELVLPAAEGLAWVKGAAVADLCLVPLMLVSRAGEGVERENALVALGRLGDPRALPELELIADGGAEDAPADDSMKRAAVEGLGRLHNSLSDEPARARIWDRVESAALDDDDDRAWRGVRALRAMGDERSRQTLVRVLQNDPGDTVVVEACEAVAALGAVEAESAVADKLESWDDDIRKAARKALDKLFPTDRTRVELHVLDHANDDDEKRAAASYLANEGSADVLLPRLLTVDDDELRTRLRLGLVRRPSLPTAPLLALLSSSKPAAVAEAARIIAARPTDGSSPALGEGLVAAEGALHGDLDDTAVSASLDVIAALVHIDATRAAVLARLRLDDVGPRVRRVLLSALAAGGTSADVPRLVGSLRDADVGVRAEAVSALTRLSKKPWQDAKASASTDPLRLSAIVPPDSALLDDDTARAVVVPTLLRTPASLIEASRGKGAGAAIATAALGRVDDGSARERLSALARDKTLGTDARKAAYRALRRAERLHHAHQRREKPDAALPSWSGKPTGTASGSEVSR
jgi:ParB family chromosome partitioning protein